MDEITADWMTLMGQAPATAGEYYRAALQALTDAKEPAQWQVLAAIELAKVAASDFRSSAISVAADKIARALGDIASSLAHEDQ